MPGKSVLVTLFLKGDSLLNRIVVGFKTIHHGFWLGILQTRHLHQLGDMSFSSHDLYSQENYNLSGLYDWEQSALEEFFKGCNTILIGAAGGGREAIAIPRLGMEVTAFECCPNLVKHCQKLIADHDCSTQVLSSLPDQTPENLGTFDGFIMGWGGYMHIPSRKKRIQFLSSIRSHLKSDSPILLSFFSRPNESLHFRWVMKIANLLRRVLRREPSELGDSFLSTLYVHYFTKEEIATELNEAGFQLTRFNETPYPHAVAKVVHCNEEP